MKDIIIITFSCVAGFFGLLVLIGTVLDALSKCTPDKIIVSKSNNFMPVKFSDEDAIQHMPVNENQPFLTHDDVQKSNSKLHSTNINSVLFLKKDFF